MFRVDYKSKKFGYIGNDFFIDDSIKETLPAIVKAIANRIGEDVEYQIIGGY